MDSEWNGFAFDLDLHDGHDASPPASLATTTAAAKAVLPDKKRQRVKGTTTPVTDKRLNDVHGQLIEANERIHVLEALVKQQLLWLEEEREAHGQTWREAKEATDQFHRERTVHDRQTDFTPLLEQQEADLDELRGQLAQADIMHQMTNARVQEAEARIAALETELQAERASNFDLAHQVAAGEQKFNEKQAEAASLVYALEASRRAAARTDEHMLEVCKELEEVKGNVTSLEGELATAKKEAFDACVEVSRLGEAAADSLTTERAMTAAVLAVVRIAARLGDPQAEGKALTDQIDYAAWRRGATAMMETAELNAVVVQGAATVIGTLIPILYGLYMDAGVKNEKLITNYDALATHAKALEADLAGCKCPEMRAYIAQIEKEMTEAESLIHKQNGTNQDLHIRVQRRSAVESFRVDVDGQGMFKDLVMVRDQKKQLQDQVQRLERDLASARTATANLQKEKGQIAARLLEAEKQIPPPRALLFVGDLEDNVEQLRRSLGPLGDSTPCNQCTIYLGKAREAERKRSIAEQSVVEEQRRLVKMTEDNKLFVEAKIKASMGASRFGFRT
jgi:chromosome segregation ATPase